MFENVKKNLPRIALVTLVSVGICGFTIAPKASADMLDQRTTITFSAPVEVPGTVLPAGTYTFRILSPMDTGSDQIVQILNEQGTHVYATLLTAPEYRARATDQTVIRFGERTADAPQPIVAWFYPNRHTGQEFLYTNGEMPRPIAGD
jgi:hypothetical protein